MSSFFLLLDDIQKGETEDLSCLTAPEEDTVPETGAEDHAGLYTGITVISLMSLAAVLYRKKRIYR